MSLWFFNLPGRNIFLPYTNMPKVLPFTVSCLGILIHSITYAFCQLDDPTLLHETSLLDGKWVQARLGQHFDIEGSFASTGSFVTAF